MPCVKCRVWFTWGELSFCKMALKLLLCYSAICRSILDMNIGDVLRILQYNPQAHLSIPHPWPSPCIMVRDVAMVMDWMCCCGQSVIMACRPPSTILDYLDTKRARISNKGSSTRQATFLMLKWRYGLFWSFGFHALCRWGHTCPLCHLPSAGCMPPTYS